MTTEYRIRQLELGHEELWERLTELERRTPVPVRTTPAPRAAEPRPQAPVPAPFPAPSPAPPPKALPPTPAPRQGAINFEDLLGGRILALIGGVAVVLSGAFFLALAISNGWIGEGARTGLAAAGSLALFAFGVWLHERRGRTYASLSITGAALACMFLTVTVAAEVYDLIPASLALGLAMLVGACGTILAVRWSAVPIGAIGIVGALLAPVLAGAPYTGTTIALLCVANAAAAAVLVWQRWDWLGVACFLVAGPQWAYWALEHASTPGTLMALVAFGALGVGAAIGFELRVTAARLRASSAHLLSLNAVGLATVGYVALTGQGEQTVAEAWLAVLAVAHLGVGIAGSRLDRVSQEISLLAFVLGVVLADIAFTLIVSGPAVALGFAGASVVFAWLLRREQGGLLPETVIGIGIGSHVLIALAHVLAVDAPVAALAGEPIELLSAVLVLGSVCAAVFTSARLVAKRHRELRGALDALGLAVVAYTAVLVFDGALLVAALAVAAVVLARLAQQTGDDLFWAAAAAYLGGAVGHTLAIEAPPLAVVIALGDVVAATVALGACALGAFACARLVRERDGEWRVAMDALGLALAAYAAVVVLDGALLVAVLAGAAVALALAARHTKDPLLSVASLTYLGGGMSHVLALEAPPQALVFGVDSLLHAFAALSACGVAALTCAHLWQGDRMSRVTLWCGGAVSLLYLASVAIVTSFQPGGAETAVLELPVRQQGQVLVSALWGLTGLCALLAGLHRDVRELRTCALALLLATVAKVFLYDLSTLGSVYRVVSFLALGGLLLAASFAYQRLRPTPLPDLREVRRALQ